MKIEMTPKQVLYLVIQGIKNGQYQAAINIAEDCIDYMNKEEKKDDNRKGLKSLEKRSTKKELSKENNSA